MRIVSAVAPDPNYAFSTNVTQPSLGTYYKFQPFADLRFRLAFADSVNMTQVNQQVNNEFGQVASNVVPPGLPPAGAFNSSSLPIYSFNLAAAQNLVVDAMKSPVTRFNFVNGSAAPADYNNTFGCPPCNRPTRPIRVGPSRTRSHSPQV